MSDDTSLTVPNKGVLSKFTDIYTTNRVVRSLMTLASVGAPILGPVDVALAGTLQKIRDKQEYAFFEALNRGEHLLTPELVESEDFVHSFVATYRAALHTKSVEKIRRFARLLLHSVENETFKKDEFEEYLAILEELSDREFVLLTEIAAAQERYFDKSFDKRYTYEELFAPMFRKLGIAEDELTPLVLRLDRTGLLLPRIGEVKLLFESGKVINDRYQQLIQWIQDIDEQ